MKRGVVLIAHNSERADYYGMAIYTAKRIEKYLNLPTSLITDHDTLKSVKHTYSFDNTYILAQDGKNYLKKTEWINKGRYRVFDVSPYDETILLDTDYMVNSKSLLNSFDYSSDFLCHNKCHFFMINKSPEFLHKSNHETLWATVIRFRKTKRVEQIFNMIKMVQNNYTHYGKVYSFLPNTYRNDYALTIALRTINNHTHSPEDYFKNRLLHITPPVKIKRVDETSYVLENIIDKDNRKLIQYMNIKDIDFHVLGKENFMELM